MRDEAGLAPRIIAPRARAMPADENNWPEAPTCDKCGKPMVLLATRM
jgi:hypothetical protein